MVTVWEWSEFSRIAVGLGWWLLLPSIYHLARMSPSGS
jgi:hypothetical protein